MSESRARELGLKPRARVRRWRLWVVTHLLWVMVRFRPRAGAEKSGAFCQRYRRIRDEQAFAAQILPCIKDLGLMEQITRRSTSTVARSRWVIRWVVPCAYQHHAAESDGTQRRPVWLATMCIGLGQGIATVFERV